METNWSEKTAQSFIKRVPNADSIHMVWDKNHFSWQAGYVMFAELIEPGVVCLVKGSRSMRMEEVAEPLSRLVAGGAACC